MARLTIRFDSGGFRDVLNSAATRGMVASAADRIAASVRPMVDGADVLVDHYTTDRAAAAVVIADLRGARFQAESGVLTRAAGGIGAEVRAR